VAETFEARVDGGTVRGERDGAGEPALVLHGGPGLSDYTEPLAAELAEDFATIRYQQRGFEPGPLAGATVDGHVADAIAILDALELRNGDRVLIVVDNSEVAVWKSFRNLGERVRLILPRELNAYDVLVSDSLVFSRESLAKVVDHFGGNGDEDETAEDGE
jgi:hypothetical protein